MVIVILSGQKSRVYYLLMMLCILFAKKQQSIEQNRAKAMVQLKSPISKAEIPLKNVFFESSPPCSWRHWSGDPTNNNENGGGAVCGEGK